MGNLGNTCGPGPSRLVLLLISGALLVPAQAAAGAEQQEFAVFGQFRASLNQIDDGYCSAEAGRCTDTDFDGLSFRNNASSLGLRGRFEREGRAAYLKLILRAHNDEIFNSGNVQTIIYQAGLRGPWGDLSYGVGSTPYKLSGQRLDPFWDTSASARGFDGPGVGLSDLTWGFTKNLLSWHSAELLGAGWRAEAALIIDDGNEDRHDGNLGLKYQGAGWSAGLQYLALSAVHPTAKSPGEGRWLRLWASGALGPLTLAASAEQGRNEDPGREDQRHRFVAVSWQAAPAWRWALSLGRSATDQPALDGEGFNVGLFHQFLDSTELHLLYSRIDRDRVDADHRLIALGVVHSFGWSASR